MARPSPLAAPVTMAAFRSVATDVASLSPFLGGYSRSRDLAPAPARSLLDSHPAREVGSRMVLTEGQ